MNTITVKNLSVLMDYAALGRVAHFIAGEEYNATHNASGHRVAKIKRRGNVYTVTDADEPEVGTDKP